MDKVFHTIHEFVKIITKLLSLTTVSIAVWSLKCYHCDYSTLSQCDPDMGNRSTLLECTPNSNRCFKKTIHKAGSDDKIEQGCTNEDGCGIHKNECDASGECTSYCCEEDLCNRGTNFNWNRAFLLFIIIAANLGFLV